MDWKEFFKPTFVKVVSTLIISSVVEYFVYHKAINSVICDVVCEAGVCPPCVGTQYGLDVVGDFLIPVLLGAYLLVCGIVKKIEK